MNVEKSEQSLSSKSSQHGWGRLMAKFGLPEQNATYERLIKSYSEKHRAYHTLDHIEACFRHLSAVENELNAPHEVELALWFHDVIYKPLSKTNEEDSADLAKTFLLKNGVDAACATRVFDLIILTKAHKAPDETDAKFMLDIDLSILGTPPHIYDQFEKDVRFEYKWVPAPLFNKTRKGILQGFLERTQIYYTEYFQAKLETQAKENLARVIAGM